MGSLLNLLKITKLDSEADSINKIDTVTSYSPNNTGTPTNRANPGAPNNFYQRFSPTETYIQFTKSLPGKSNLLSLGSAGLDPNTEAPLPPYNVFDATNLDIEKPGVDGGIPYKQEKDPTVYSPLTRKSTSTPGYFAQPGKSSTKYNQIYTPTNTYLNYIAPFTVGSGRVGATVPATGVRDLGPGTGNPRTPGR